MKNASNALLGIVVACGMVVLGAVFVWAPPCSEGIETAMGNIVPMRCTWTAHAGALLGIVITVVAMGALAFEHPVDGPLCIALVALSAALFAISFESPVTIGVCTSDGMACAATALWLRGCGLVALVSSVAAALSNPDRKQA